jgi:hypothetical protein
LMAVSIQQHFFEKNVSDQSEVTLWTESARLKRFPRPYGCDLRQSCISGVV